MADDDVADPAVVAAARSLADRARSDGITPAMLRQAATIKLRPGFAAALMFAVEQGWIEDPWQGVEKDGGPDELVDVDGDAGDRFVG